MNEAASKREQELEETLRQGIAVVEDFMPNIGHCALQDYGRLNAFLINSKRLLDKNDAQRA